MPNDYDIHFFPWLDFPIPAKKEKEGNKQRVFDVDYKLAAKQYEKARNLKDKK